ncbi:MAG: patatin-like phospholipase family protein, partial [Lachnospiraceae bacterium]|nr:patatin-like phospholipase family protein [Lachnospiraceae bacterium]
MTDAALILEGGGMRGIYTAGVLDFFLDKKIEFPVCYAVSAGACHGSSFLA